MWSCGHVFISPLPSLSIIPPIHSAFHADSEYFSPVRLFSVVVQMVEYLNCLRVFHQINIYNPSKQFFYTWWFLVWQAIELIVSLDWNRLAYFTCFLWIIVWINSLECTTQRCVAVGSIQPVACTFVIWYFDYGYNLYCVGGDVKHCSIQSNPILLLCYLWNLSVAADWPQWTQWQWT